MDHSDDKDSKLPPAAAAQSSTVRGTTMHQPQQQQQQQQQQPPPLYWDTTAQQPSQPQRHLQHQYPQHQQQQQQQQQQHLLQYPIYSSVSSLPQQQQQQQLGVQSASSQQLYPTRHPPGFSTDVITDPYHRQRQQQLLYQQAMQQQVAAAAAAASVYPGYSGAASLVRSAHHPPYVTTTTTTSVPQVPPSYYTSPASGGGGGTRALPTGYLPQPTLPPPSMVAFPPRVQVGRKPIDRPLIKLSVSLIDTYKQINTVYYEDREARRQARAKEKSAKALEQQQQGVGGANNHGWDDENYDYIVTSGEIFYNRYKIKERIGKGSFGQVVRAEDMEHHREVAIKIIKSKKPFLMQAKTEIELLTHLWEKDPEDQHNIVRLLTHFMYRNHQCLVFEMLSLNLYELLKNTQFGGVSLNLIRKFGKQVLKALEFLAKSDVDIIHCDLKPENILLRHPKKSGVKVIDFGSSCRSNKRMYSYIQSRFYRSPEVMLGLQYSVAIDMWSLGCILAEMHTGEPIFSGSDQFDQMQKIVKLLGMVPDPMIEKSTEHVRSQFFEKKESPVTGIEEWHLRQTKLPQAGDKVPTVPTTTPSDQPSETTVIVPSADPVATLKAVITAGNKQQKKFPPSEAYNSQKNYTMFVDLVYKMLTYDPEKRIKPAEALSHPFILATEQALATSASTR